MSSTLSSARSRFFADATKPSLDASRVSADKNVLSDRKNEWFSIKKLLLDRRILFAIVLMFTFCVGVVATLVLQSSKGRIASIPQAGPAATAPSNLEHQLEAMSLGLAAVRQSLAELVNDLGQVKQDIAGLLSAEQALFDKVSELPPRPTAASTPKPTPRPVQAPPVR